MATPEQKAAWDASKLAQQAALEDACRDIPEGGIRVLTETPVPAVVRKDGVMREVVLAPLVEAPRAAT